MSIGPDPDGTCTLYKKFDCTDEVRTITFPGMAGGLPKFTAFKCMPNANAMPRGINSTRPGALAKTLDPLADPRLAGGFGSVERMHQLEQIKAMEADGFKDGLIGLKKGVYY